MNLEFSIRSLLNQLGMKYEGTIDLKDVLTGLHNNGLISEAEYLFICRSVDKNRTEQASPQFPSSMRFS